MIKNLLFKISALMLVFSLSLVGTTYGRVIPVGFNDFEESLGNNLSTTTLDFSLTSSSFNISSFKPGDNASASAQIKKDGALDFNYNISAVKTGGDDNLCNALQIEAKLDGVTKYSGGLMGLSLVPVLTIGGSGQDDWTFILTLASSDASLQDKSCNFNIFYKGWQTDSDGTWGFMDEELVGNNVASGNWGAASSGDVVINEVMWMGSTESTADEWMELRNMTDHEIDIGQWTLDNTKDGGDRQLMISASKSIPAQGYFLISNYPKTSAKSALNMDVDEVANLEFLNTSNGNIILKNKNGVVIDQAKGNSWPAGENGTNKKSMERNDAPGDGLETSSWHTCVDNGCRSTTFWDSEGNNYGTPKAANLSENDPSSPEYIPVPEVIEINIPPESSPAAHISPESVSLPILDSLVENQPPTIPEVTPTPILPEPIVTSVPEQQSTPVTEDKKNE